MEAKLASSRCLFLVIRLLPKHETDCLWAAALQELKGVALTVVSGFWHEPYWNRLRVQLAGRRGGMVTAMSTLLCCSLRRSQLGAQLVVSPSDPLVQMADVPSCTVS